jgi:FlaA1/EpsC-like NDP-sugar epimerase
MGEQIKISSLAEELIRLSGVVPYKDIDIVFTGLRPGEKLHEELVYDSEGITPSSHEKIFVAQSCPNISGNINDLLDQLSVACRTANLRNAMPIISAIVPEYKSSSSKLHESILKQKYINSKLIHAPKRIVVQ